MTTTLISARVPKAWIAALDAAALAGRQRRATLVRELIRRGLGLKDELPAAKAKPVVHCPVLRHKPVNFKPAAKTALELFEAGFKLQAIAAMTRRPYAEIAREIGQMVDAKVGGRVDG